MVRAQPGELPSAPGNSSLTNQGPLTSFIQTFQPHLNIFISGWSLPIIIDQLVVKKTDQGDQAGASGDEDWDVMESCGGKLVNCH